ncbi:RNA polymerase sigma factor [Streptomyces sp. NPDC001667]
MLDATADRTVAGRCDADPLSEVFACYYDRVHRFILARLARPDWHLAEDLTSEVFVRMVRWYAGRAFDGRVWGLLAQIARHVITDHFRRARNTREAATDFGDWSEARRLPVAPAAEECAVERLTALAALTRTPVLGVAA